MADFGYTISDTTFNVYRIDLETLTAENVGTLSALAPQDLEGLGSEGTTIYAVEETVAADPATGAPESAGDVLVFEAPTAAAPDQQIAAMELVLDPAIPFGDEVGADFDSGSLFILRADAEGGSTLISVDPLTGAATQIGTSPNFADGLAISSAGAFAVDFSGADTLYSLDVTTGALTAVGPLSADGATDFDADSGLGFTSEDQLIAFTEDGNLYSVDTSTGAAELLGNVTLGGAPLAEVDGGDLEGFTIIATPDIMVPGGDMMGMDMPNMPMV
ncbi:MAG: hypothetical protein HC890_13180 [Chloroflexaceae bacterium]|nr:hypothetical protein [Chloroflexaceae bacterium]